jgi:hypothetical protein
LPRRLIHRTALSESLPVPFEGADVISWHAAILEGLEGTPGLADFLALPVRVAPSGWINWYTALPGEPRAVESLPPGEREPAAARAGELLELFRRTAERLRGADRYRDRQAGEAMRAAVSHAEALAFFSVGGSIVCAGWGLEKPQPLPFEPETEPPPPVPVPEPVFFPPPPPPEPEPLPAPAPPPPPARDPGGRLRRLAPGIAVGLIAGLLAAYALSPAFREGLGALFLGGRAAGLETREEALAGLRGDLQALRSRYSGRRGACLVVPQGPPPAGGPSYLDGCYASRPGVFYDAASGEGRTLSLCARGGGAAEFLIAPASGEGGTCRAGAAASAAEGRLVVTSGAGPVCGGDSYPPLRVSCSAGVPPGTQAVCEMEEQGEGGEWYEPVPVELRQAW